MRNMQMQRVILVFLSASMFCLIQGCSMSGSDAGRYVQAVLDTEWKGKSGDYVRITDSTKEEASQVYEANVAYVLSLLQGTATDSEVSEDIQKRFSTRMKKVMEKTEYQVGEGEKQSGGYVVPVTVRQLSISDGMEEEVVQQMQAQVKGMPEVPGEEEIRKISVSACYRYLGERLENPVYKEKEEIPVRVWKNERDVWEISEEDLEKLNAHLLN